MISVSTAICVVKPRPRISSGTTTAAIHLSINSRRVRKKKRSAKRRRKVARSRPSEATAVSKSFTSLPLSLILSAPEFCAKAEAEEEVEEDEIDSRRADNCRLRQQRRRWDSGRPENLQRARRLRVNRGHLRGRGNAGKSCAHSGH